jgi:hypothetical protein
MADSRGKFKSSARVRADVYTNCQVQTLKHRRENKMIKLSWSNSVDGKETKNQQIDKSVYFELLRPYRGRRSFSLSHIHRGSRAFLKSDRAYPSPLKPLKTRLKNTKTSLKRLVKSGDAEYVGNNKWRLRMEFTVEERREAKKLSNELSIPMPEPELIKLAKKSGNSISDLLCQISQLAYVPYQEFIKGRWRFVPRSWKKLSEMVSEGAGL